MIGIVEVAKEGAVTTTSSSTSSVDQHKDITSTTTISTTMTRISVAETKDTAVQLPKPSSMSAKTPIAVVVDETIKKASSWSKIVGTGKTSPTTVEKKRAYAQEDNRTRRTDWQGCCSHWARNGCRNGDSCQWKHSLPTGYVCQNCLDVFGDPPHPMHECPHECSFYQFGACTGKCVPSKHKSNPKLKAAIARHLKKEEPFRHYRKE